MKKKHLICTLLCLIFVLCGCSVAEEKPQLNEQQLQCEHEWAEIDWHAEIANDGSGVTYDIYCPKCQLETNVSYKEWNRIQVDMDYQNNN